MRVCRFSFSEEKGTDDHGQSENHQYAAGDFVDDSDIVRSQLMPHFGCKHHFDDVCHNVHGKADSEQDNPFQSG
jgi:hypothetical protein